MKFLLCVLVYIFAFISTALAQHVESCALHDVRYSRTILGQLENAGIAETDYDRREEFIDRYLEKHQGHCQLIGIALQEKFIVNVQADRVDAAFAAGRKLLDSRFWQQHQTDDMRRTILALNLSLAREHGKSSDLLALFEPDLDLFLLPGDEGTLKTAVAFSAAGSDEKASEFAEAIVEQNNFFSAPDESLPPLSNARNLAYENQKGLLWGAFGVLSVSKPSGVAAELMYPSVRDIQMDNMDLAIVWMAVVASDQSTPATERLARVEPIFEFLQHSRASAYISPYLNRLYVSAMMSILESAGREGEARKLGKRTARRLGEAFDPSTVISGHFESVRRWVRGEQQHVGEIPPPGKPESTEAVKPNWPWEADYNVSVNCECRFNIDATGKPKNVIAQCTDERFRASARNSIKRARWNPSFVNGAPVTLYNVIQPLEYRPPN